MAITRSTLQRYSLTLFFASLFISETRQLGIQVLGNWYAVVGRYANVTSLPLSLLAVWTFTRGGGIFKGLSVWTTIWVYLIVGIVSVLTVIGHLHGYGLKYILQDVYIFVYFIVFILLGAQPAFWRPFLKAAFVIFALGIILNIASLWVGGGALEFAGSGDRLAREMLAYRTQSPLDYYPILLLTLAFFSSFRAFVVIIGVAFYFFLQVMFQKRFDTAEILLWLLIYFTIFHFRNDNPGNAQVKNSRKIVTPLICCICIIGGFVIITLRPDFFLAQAESLLRRYTGESMGYQHGFFSIFTLEENERYKIVTECFKTFNSVEWMIGRGMGGAYEYLGVSEQLLLSDSGDDYFGMWFLPDLQIFGRRNFEVGFFMPLLKGGFLLLGVIVAGQLAVIARFRRMQYPFFTRVAYWIVIIGFLRSFITGTFILSAPFDFLMTSACLGWCLGQLYIKEPFSPLHSGKSPTRNSARLNSNVVMRLVLSNHAKFMEFNRGQTRSFNKTFTKNGS